MAKFKVSTKGNLVTFTQKQFRKINVNERELKVFEENLLPGFFRPKLEKANKIVYSAPMSISLDAYIKKGMTVHKLYSILAQFGEIIKSVERSGFYLHNLVLDSRVIHVKEITGELFFVYTPLMGETSGINVYGFLADTFKGIKSDDMQVMTECQKILNFLNSPNHYTLSEIEDFVQQMYPQIYQQITRKDSGKSGFISSSQLAYQQHYHPSMALQPDDDLGTTLLAKEDEGTTLLSEDEGTTLLQSSISAFLIRKKTGDTVTINRDMFRIGKDLSSDYVIADNNAISRKHATVYRSGSVFYISDDGSKNHTYVNGMIIIDGQAELHNGDIVKLANDEFEFFIN